VGSSSFSWNRQFVWVVNFILDKVQYCPGEVCEIKDRHEIQKTSVVQLVIVLAFIGWIVLSVFLFKDFYAEKPFDLFGMEDSGTSQMKIKKEHPKVKSKLHPRNKNRERYDFNQLIGVLLNWSHLSNRIFTVTSLSILPIRML
jgi:hypothetical protein